MTATSIGHRPTGSWSFDDSVTAVFDDMLARSIPDLDAMRRILVEVVGAVPTDGGPLRVLDVGASLGGVARSLEHAGVRATVRGLDNSPAMVRQAQNLQPHGCTVEAWDVLDQGLPSGKFDAITSCFTLQFLPIESRAAVLSLMRQRIRHEGVVFVAEKVQGEHPADQDWLVRLYHHRKIKAGYSPADVAAKAIALRHSMACHTERENVAVFQSAGFRVQPVWRSLCFAAWQLSVV